MQDDEDIYNLPSTVQPLICSLYVVKSSQSDPLLSMYLLKDIYSMSWFVKHPQSLIKVSQLTSGDIHNCNIMLLFYKRRIWITNHSRSLCFMQTILLLWIFTLKGILHLQKVGGGVERGRQRKYTEVYTAFYEGKGQLVWSQSFKWFFISRLRSVSNTGRLYENTCKTQEDWLDRSYACLLLYKAAI